MPTVVMKCRGKLLVGILGVLIILAVVFATKLFVRGHTSPITAEDGAIAPESIALLEQVSLGGMDQWVLMRGHSEENPVLLWLHGGPGAAQMPLSHAYDAALEKEFIVVHWDQRGAGKSNTRRFDETTMTYEQFIADAQQLTEYLKERFGKEKIYLVGHSWGTQLGLELVSRCPESYAAYIGISQVVSHKAGDAISYAWLLGQANEKDRKKLLRLGPPPYRNHEEFVSFIRMVDAYGGSFDVPFLTLAKLALQSPEYSLKDMVAWLGGSNRGSGPMWEDEGYRLFDAIQGFPCLQVPVYFFQGRHDYNTPLGATNMFFDALEAPQGKQLVVFENSAHTPFLAEPEQFTQELIRVKDERREEDHTRL